MGPSDEALLDKPTVGAPAPNHALVSRLPRWCHPVERANLSTDINHGLGALHP
jgi:hypothetical protein